MLSYLLSDSFNNLHLKIYLMPRLIYNRIAKAGSSTMMTLIAALSHINNFTIYSYDPYWPTQDQLRKSLERLPPDSVYINHCNFVPGKTKKNFLLKCYLIFKNIPIRYG